MSRAEKRRMLRDKFKKSNATYNLTKEQLDILIERSIRDRLNKIKEDSVDTAMLLTLALPMKVMMDYYWTNLNESELEEEASIFADRLVDYYDKWQNDEIDIEKVTEDIWKYGGVKFTDADYVCKEGEVE